MDSDAAGVGALMALVMGSLACVMVVGFILVFILVITNWRIYTKAGQPGWAAIVPIYHLFVMMDIIRKPRSWAVIILVLGVAGSVLTSLQPAPGSEQDSNLMLSLVQIVVSLASIYFSVRLLRELARVFGRGVGFTLGLLFLPIIFYPILAFGDSQYQPTVQALPGSSSIIQ